MRREEPGSEGIIHHLKELRKRVTILTLSVLFFSVVGFIFYREVASLFIALFRSSAVLSDSERDILYIYSIVEGFTTKVKLSLLFGLSLSTPIALFHTVRFISPGLFKKEKGVLLISLILSGLLVFLSLFYSYSKIIPTVIQFLTGSRFMPVETGFLLNYEKNLFYLIQFMLVSAIFFQIPLFLGICLFMRWISLKRVIQSTRYIIVGTFLLAAIVTPPDIVSQLAIALPFLLLYAAVILVGALFRMGKRDE